MQSETNSELYIEFKCSVILNSDTVFRSVSTVLLLVHQLSKLLLNTSSLS